ncbi:MAG: hypothetical protein HZA93_17320 [Verrucomicrobia bacterium]|nr:hypothetical protein [Verrucomicrobiota bacterium]
MHPIPRLLISFAGALFAFSAVAAEPAMSAPRWFKGNLHTQSLWSDGDDYPEMIADWYKRAGYHCLGSCRRCGSEQSTG